MHRLLHYYSKTIQLSGGNNEAECTGTYIPFTFFILISLWYSDNGSLGMEAKTGASAAEPWSVQERLR